MNASLLKRVKSISVQLIGSALLATPAVFLAGNAQAAVIWDWSFGGTEAGTFTTDGNFSDTTNPFTFKITDFAVTSSTLASNVGAIYTITQQPLGFIWNGSQPTQFFRNGGRDVNGTNLFNGDFQYTFFANSNSLTKIARLNNFETDDDYVSFTSLTLTPQTPAAVPEPSTILGSLALGGGVAFYRKRKAALQSAK